MSDKQTEIPAANNFDYETQGQDDDFYTAIMSNNEPPKPAHKKPGPKPGFKPKPKNTPAPGTEPMVMSGGLPMVKESDFNQLFLIEGRVRRDAIGEEPIFSEQKRLVWAQTFEDAVRKYNVYFAGLSNFNERYSVVMAGGSEAIS